MHYYLTILLASAFFPVLFSFEKRIYYFSKWRKILKTAALTSIPFLIWDIIFTQKGIWGFNESYTLGIKAFGLPIEEVLFFIFIPFSILIFWEISLYFKFYKLFNNYKIFFKFVNIISIFLILYFIKLPYTVIVMTTTLIATKLVQKQKASFQKNVIFLFFVSLPFFFIVNGLLTSLPIVWYDNTQKSGVMFSTIPLEDLFYSYSLLSLNALTYSILKFRKI